MKRLVKMVTEVFYPTRCAVCGRGGSWLCLVCVEGLALAKSQRCGRCNRPALGGVTHPKCQTKNTLEGVVGVYEYKEEVKRVIGRFKYEGRTCYAGDLVEAVLWGVREDEEDLVGLKEFLAREGELLVVPVPMSDKKMRSRGYNQAEKLAEGLAEKLAGRLVTDLVVKVRATKDQVELTKKERKKNLRGVFKLNRKYEGKVDGEVRVLLVDDVTTTGTTMVEIGRVVKRNFEVEVWGLAVAR